MADSGNSSFDSSDPSSGLDWKLSVRSMTPIYPPEPSQERSMKSQIPGRSKLPKPPPPPPRRSKSYERPNGNTNKNSHNLNLDSNFEEYLLENEDEKTLVGKPGKHVSFHSDVDSKSVKVPSSSSTKPGQESQQENVLKPLDPNFLNSLTNSSLQSSIESSAFLKMLLKGKMEDFSNEKMEPQTKNDHLNKGDPSELEAGENVHYWTENYL